MMKIYTGLTILLFIFTRCEGKINYLAGNEYSCIRCLCHAVSGCWIRQNCARYSVSFDYWKTAGSPTVDIDDDPDSQSSYNKCKKDENCIVETIIKYTDKYAKDCNCDGEFDCKDRLAIHFMGGECANPNFGSTRARRFNECAKQVGVKLMLNSEGYDGCIPEAA